MSTLRERVKHLFETIPAIDGDYYAVSLMLSASGELEFGCQTQWVGYTDETPRREIREASLVNSDRMLKSWKILGEPGMVVNTTDDFLLFFAFGGNAVIEKSLAESVIADWLRPRVSVNVGQWGFAAPSLLGESALRRAPTAKHRMRIIQRDGYKCRVCGRSPRDYVDVELHVHHIRPWAAGGVTEDSNLMTLCHTCHGGLDPHFEFNLFQLFPKQPPRERAAKYSKRLEDYQRAVGARL